MKFKIPLERENEVIDALADTAEVLGVDGEDHYEFEDSFEDGLLVSTSTDEFISALNNLGLQGE